MRSLKKYQTGGGSFRNTSLRSSGTSFTGGWNSGVKFSSNPSISSPTRYSSMFNSPSSGQQSGGDFNYSGAALTAAPAVAGAVGSIIPRGTKYSRDNTGGTFQAGRSITNNLPYGAVAGAFSDLGSSMAQSEAAEDSEALAGIGSHLEGLDALGSWSKQAEDVEAGRLTEEQALLASGIHLFSGHDMFSNIYREAMIRENMDKASKKDQEGWNWGGTSADLVNRGTEFQQGVNMRALRDQQLPMGKYGGSMNEYGKGGLYANIHAKRERIKAGSGESMRSPGSEGAPTDKAFTDSAKTAKMGMGGYMEYAQGGIHIDSSKRGTFKAQATRMDMGVQEAADKILSAPESTYSPEMRKKANFARNFAKKYGGMMEYKDGGMYYSEGVPVEFANAELEGGGAEETGENAVGEIIMRDGGKKNIKVVGPTHEERNLKYGGTGSPQKLEEGDYVWSDHLKFKDKTMAEWYEELVKTGADDSQVQQLMMIQEQLAGRAKGESMDQMAKTGGLMKYQMGTRTPLIGPNAPKPTGLDLLSDPADKETWRMWQEGRKADAIKMAAAEADKVIPKSKTSSAQVPAASQNTVPVPQDIKSTVTPMEPYTQPMTMPQRTYQPSELSTADLLPKAPEKSRNANALLKYAPELALLASGAINAALVPRSYDLPEVPAMPQISYTDVKLDRADNRADRAEAQKNLSAYMNLVRSSGSGPGSMAMVQSMRDRIIRDLEQSSQNVRQMNLSAAAQEAKMNMEAELKRKLTNAEFKMIYDKLNLERGAALADFNIQRKNNIADAITAGVLGAAETYASQRYADAISGESGVGDRQLQNNDLLRGFYARINNKKERA